MYPAFGIALIGAVPTVTQMIQALRIGVGYRDVPYATANNDMFIRNFDCLKYEGPSIKLPNNTVVQAVVCMTGDIWVRVTTPDNRGKIVWINPYDIVGRAQAGWYIGAALAAERPLRSVAADERVICVSRDRSGNIVRVLQIAPGNCRREKIDPYTGTVTTLDSVSCACPQ